MRHIPPGTTRAQHVNKRVEDLPYVYPTRSAPGLGWRNQPPHDLPLGLCQISRIGLAFHAYQFTSSSPFGMIHFSYTLLEKIFNHWPAWEGRREEVLEALRYCEGR